jgi:hypothetical protein
MMSCTARFEIIQDDIYTPACLSRSMPAAVDGLLTQAALDDFGDQLDALLVVSHMDHKHGRQLVNWMSIGFTIMGHYF